MTMFKGLLAAAISLAGITTATTAQAALVFTISKGVFRDGAAVSGSFTTSNDRATILDFTLTTGEGSFTLDSNPNGAPIATKGFTFTSVNSSSEIFSSGISFNVTGPDQTRRSIFINYRLADTIFGRPTATSFAERDAANERNSRIGEGLITAAVAMPPVSGAVPEPATWAMMLIGFGGMGYAMRRNRRTTARIRFA
ncbi:PEPxxWA-CTERM sorting domain-containing protein [Sphingomonas sp. RS2018]